jgi:hypothetical protein
MRVVVDDHPGVLARKPLAVRAASRSAGVVGSLRNTRPPFLAERVLAA